MNAFIRFHRGILRMPLQWRLWIVLLVCANVVAPMFFMHRPEGPVVLGTTLASMLMMTLLTRRFGFTRIVGLGHVLWVPMLAFLFTRLGDIPPDDAFGVWIRALFVLDGVSLVLDSADVVRYMKGERNEIVAGL